MCGALSGFVNISTLVLISIDRCSAIKDPFQVLVPQKKKNICKLYILYDLILYEAEFYDTKRLLADRMVLWNFMVNLSTF
jgi:hypothetical protein